MNLLVEEEPTSRANVMSRGKRGESKLEQDLNHLESMLKTFSSFSILSGQSLVPVKARKSNRNMNSLSAINYKFSRH